MSLDLATAPQVSRSREQRKRASLRRFVQAYWLRPENALWMTLRSCTLSEIALDQPTIDVSCGDGVFSFLHCGGAFDPDFDVFTSVAEVAQLGRKDHPCNAGEEDMFDHIGDGYKPTIVTPAAQTINVGTDYKRSMVAKAEKLSLYDWLIEHDNNQPLPFPSDAFQTAYCNAAYWITGIDQFLSELSRIVRPGGHVVLQVKISSMAHYTLAAHRQVLGDRFLAILDRGRSACWPTLADRATWERRFDAAGLTVESATPFITKTHAHIWDVGLRPIAPLLVKMAQALSPTTRASIKREWVDLMIELLEPLCVPDLNLFSITDDPAEIQYVLSPT